MRKSLLLALLCSPLLANTPAVSAADVSSLTACKADGEVWLCASWKNNQMTVYRSQRYISEVEFAGELEPGAPLARIEGAKPGVNAEVSAAQGSYTLQLLACNSEPCRQQLEQLKQIPGSHEVEIKNDNTLWQVLLGWALWLDQVGPAGCGQIDDSVPAARQTLGANHRFNQPSPSRCDSLIGGYDFEVC